MGLSRIASHEINILRRAICSLQAPTRQQTKASAPQAWKAQSKWGSAATPQFNEQQSSKPQGSTVPWQTLLKACKWRENAVTTKISYCDSDHTLETSLTEDATLALGHLSQN